MNKKRFYSTVSTLAAVLLTLGMLSTVAVGDQDPLPSWNEDTAKQSITLIVLSSMGINIGPLLAGAGVAGLAIGFGAQKLVADVLSGIFYLVDDAFRVGEYIQAGSVSGSVAAITLRNVMLRHHRGMLQIIPPQ
jgi:hypothetical protein